MLKLNTIYDRINVPNIFNLIPKKDKPIIVKMLGSKSYLFRYYRIFWRQSEHSVLLRSASVLRIFYKTTIGCLYESVGIESFYYASRLFTK